MRYRGIDWEDLVFGDGVQTVLYFGRVCGWRGGL